MPNVLHIVRKKDQLKSTFILNQVVNHSRYMPFIAYRKDQGKSINSTYANLNLDNFTVLNLSQNETIYEKLLFKTIKKLSARQFSLLEKFIKENNIQILHFHYGTDCGVFYPILNRLPVRSVVSFYGYDCSSFPSLLFGFGKYYLKRRVFKHITNVFAMSPDMKNDLIKAGCMDNKIIVHYYGTDASKFFIKRTYEQRGTITLLILATVVPQKGHLFLLKSILELVKQGTRNFRLRIVGKGELEEELKQFVVINELSNHVQFIGAVNYLSTEMMYEYQIADVFVHPSVIAANGDKEGIPGTIVEAMASGLPVVSTYHAGIPFIIEDESTGLLVNEHDVSALANRLKMLINDMQLRKSIGTKGQERALHALNLVEKEKELEQLYDNILK